MNLLVIGDIHAPGNLRSYLRHIKDTAERFNIDRLVQIGDLVDFHYISRHPTETDALNAIQELDEAKKEIKRWTREFPDMQICQGNHDMIPYRQASSMMIPPEFMRSLNDLLDLPDTWTWHRYIKIGNTVIEHGLGSGGMYGAKRTAEKYRCNYIQGHTHSYGGVWWLDGPFDRLFAMQVGCGVDTSKYFMRYGRDIFKHNVALGCGVVLDADSKNPLPIYVPIKEKHAHSINGKTNSVQKAEAHGRSPGRSVGRN